MPEEALKEANRELSRLEKLPTVSPEYSIIRTYLELLTSLPWSRSTGETIDVPRARQVLDQDHYDLEKIKDRILEYLAVRRLKEERMAEQVQRSKEMATIQDGIETDEIRPTQPLVSQEALRQINREPILCFVGPPGVGKTSLGQSIARALGRKFARMSLGGIRDEAEIRGHRRTYIGAMPGRIIQTLRRVDTNDPVVMLDEVDKVGADWRGDPSSALLEVLDPEQNYNFRDNYLDLAFDLSHVMFIATANALEPIPPALRDRMEILELSGYTEEQKLHIARNFLLPKQLEANGLKQDELTVDDAALRRVARDYTREAGVRNLEREIGSLCRKIAKQVAEGKQTPIHVTAEDVPEYLGRQRFFQEVAERIDRPGIATGLTWTPVGGEIIFIGNRRAQLCTFACRIAGPACQCIRESECAYPRPGGSHPQRRPLGRRDHGNGPRLAGQWPQRALRCRHDRRDHLARQSHAHWRHKREGAGRLPFRHSHSHPAQEERTGPAGGPA